MSIVTLDRDDIRPATSLRDLVAKWEAWAGRETVESAAAQAEAQGNVEIAERLRETLADHADVSALEALDAAHRIAVLLADGQARTVAAAAAAGATWEQIGQALDVRPDAIRADHAATSRKRPAGADTEDAAADLIWLTCAQAAARVHRDPSTIRRSAEHGDLHGHQPLRNGRPVPGSRWTIHVRAVDAWTQGLDVAAQIRACGCPALAGGKSRGGGAR